MTVTVIVQLMDVLNQKGLGFKIADDAIQNILICLQNEETSMSQNRDAMDNY